MGTARYRHMIARYRHMYSYIYQVIVHEWYHALQYMRYHTAEGSDSAIGVFAPAHTLVP